MFDSTENNLESLENYQKRVRILQDLESMDQTSLKRSIKILGNKDDFWGFELTWYNSKFYNSPSKPGPVFPYYQ